MKKLFIIFLSILFSVFCWFYFSVYKSENLEQPAKINVSEIMSEKADSGFSHAFSPIKFHFPRDFASHPNFKNEWWYFTGNVKTETGRSFGFQFTIFRNSLSADPLKRKSHWATNQFYMGHFALTDIEGNKFYAFERFNRGAQGLAGAQVSPLRVWLDDWMVEGVKDSNCAKVPIFFLKANEKNKKINIKLKSAKPIVVHGNHGLSQKGAKPGNASYYYSLTRLKAAGQISLNGKKFDVSGFAWLEREWSTSAWDEDQVGWDWFSLQLEDGREIMYYQIRNRNGEADIFSKGTFIEKDGSYRTINKNEIELTVLDHWENPQGIKYPSKWRMKLLNKNIDLKISPNLKNQELPLSIKYWEGSVSFEGFSKDKKIKGLGYLEMTGYVQK